MSKARPVVQDSMELAKRINDSTDIVTDLTDVVQNELPQKAIQGDNPEATNSEILRAIDNIDIDTTGLAQEETLVQGVSGIRNDIAHIPAPDLSAVAKEETLVQGVSGIRNDIAHIPAPDLSAVAKEETLSSGILGILQELAPKATQAQLESATAAIINALPTDYAKQGTNTAATNSAILEATDTIDEKIDDISTGLEDVAKEETATANKQEILTAIESINITPITDEHIESLFPEINEDA